ncbi:MAG: ribonuclease HI [Phycisphaerae bacterium]|nr:ribonuclease HI [Phycisphaerae bacterium]
MKQVIIYTDGACHGNPGPGGWAAILVHGTARREISGAEPATTNNRMEIRAAIEALRALREPCAVVLYTDSEYVCKAMSEWLPKWKAKGWRRGREPLKNVDLWQQLDEAASRHQVKWMWVRGHAGHPENERCDQLANEATAALRDRSSI